jgi:hypothetical protein
VQLRNPRERTQHVERIGSPVSGDAQRSADRESTSEQLRECTLHEAALVMALLRPGVGKEDENLL